MIISLGAFAFGATRSAAANAKALGPLLRTGKQVVTTGEEILLVAGVAAIATWGAATAVQGLLRPSK